MYIQDIEVYIPENMQPIDELLQFNGFNDRVIKIFKRFHKLNQVPIVKHTQKLEETLTKSLEKISIKYDLKSVDLVIYTHSLIPQVPYDYNLLYNVLKSFNIEQIPAYGISHLNCASFFGALAYARDFFIKNSEAESILIITGDQANFIPEVRFIDGATVMGDAATVTLITKNGDYNRMLSLNLYISTKQYTGYDSTPEELHESNKFYISDLSYSIEKVLNDAKCTLEDIKIIFPHNVNRTTWVNFCKANKIMLDKVLLDLVPKYGHLYCSDSQINLSYALQNNLLNKGDKYLLVGVGLGPIFGTALFEH